MNYKYPYNIVFILVPILALILLILAYRKKRKNTKCNEYKSHFKI